jgi:hypothetical protein
MSWLGIALNPVWGWCMLSSHGVQFAGLAASYSILNVTIAAKLKPRRRPTKRWVNINGRLKSYKALLPRQFFT